MEIIVKVLLGIGKFILWGAVCHFCFEVPDALRDLAKAIQGKHDWWNK